jgi:hypothetical protein
MPQIDHGKLLHSLKECVAHLSQGALSPVSRALEPRLGDQGGRALRAMCRELGSEAAALFLVSDTHPDELKFEFGHGYDSAYRHTPYKISETSFTTSVFLGDQTVNRTREALNKRSAAQGITYTSRCDQFLSSGQCRNVLAVPIRLGERRIGVLKAENKLRPTKAGTFTPTDEKLMELVALTIAPLVRQSRTIRLFSEADQLARQSTTARDYLDGIALLLCRSLEAEACSVFLPRGNDALYYGGGFGYTDVYPKHIYSLQENEKSHMTSVTAWLFRRRATLSATESQLRHSSVRSGFVFSQSCSERIEKSKTLRDVIGVAIVNDFSHFNDEKAPCMGVIKIENCVAMRRPDPMDEALVCALIVNYVAPKLRFFQQEREAVDAITKVLGPAVEYNRQNADWKKQFVKVMVLHQRGEITIPEWAGYYDVSTATIVRTRKQAFREGWERQFGEA